MSYPMELTEFATWYQNRVLELLETQPSDVDAGTEDSDPCNSIEHRLSRAIADYIGQNMDGSRQEWENLDRHFKSNIGSAPDAIESVLFYLYDSLSCLSQFEENSAAQQQHGVERVEANLDKLKSFLAPNLSLELPELQLVLAEFHRFQGERVAAMEAYDRSIGAAQIRENTCVEAIANERAGLFYKNWEKPKIGAVYFQEAYQLYLTWGARAQADNLARKYLQDVSLPRQTSRAADWQEVLQLSQTLSGTLHLDRLFVALMQIAIEKTDADVGISILVDEDQLAIAARCVPQTATAEFIAECNLEWVTIEPEKTCVLEVPQTVIDYVRRDRKLLAITEEAFSAPFAGDPYFSQRRPKSFVCLPILSRGNLKGMIYLESSTRPDAFGSDRLELLQLLASQAAISIENAQLYARIEDYSHTLEQKVDERTTQLQQEIDIRTQTEAALRESENRYRTLFENSALQLWELDLSGLKQYFNCIQATGIQDFSRFFYTNPYVIFQCLKRIKVVHVNPATYQAFGAKNEAKFLENLNPISLFVQDFNVVREATIALAQGRQKFKSEFRYKKADGSVGYVLLYLDIARGYRDTLEKAIVSAIEIGDRKQAESALKESESKYRALVEASQDAIWSVDESGCYTFVNPAVQRIYGYAPDEFIGRTIADFAPPDDRDRLRAQFDGLLTEKTFFQQELVHQTREGKPIHLLFSGIVRRNYEGYILGATGTATDITDRKHAEIELQRAKEAADAANRAKSEFLANMSHELRTPLNAILGFTQVMYRDPTLSAEHQDYLQIISQSGEHLLELINNILEMSRIESGRIALHQTQFDLDRLLDTLEAMLAIKAKEKGLWLKFEKTHDVPQYIQTDERKLRQVLIHLLSNAIKFTVEGGVTLRVALVEKPDSIARDRGQLMLRFEVEDTGLGIKPEDLDTLFIPFAQAPGGRKVSEGTGLGLPIGYRFVQLMGGEIWVRSTVGRGSCFGFELRLPAIDAAVLPTPTRWGKAIGIEPNPVAYRISIADARPDSRQFMVKLMESLGLEVKEAKNAQEAVVLWETWRPHLMWMDMQMPGRDGYLATEQIKARSRLLEGESLANTVIVALTASDLERDRRAILSVGCDDLVSKPLQEEIILEKLARHLGVRYCFAQPIAQTHREPATGVVKPTLESLREELSHLPDLWILQSYQAAIKCSDRHLLMLIEQIPPERRLLTTILKDWVSHFRFDRAIELLKPMAERCHQKAEEVFLEEV